MYIYVIIWSLKEEWKFGENSTRINIAHIYMRSISVVWANMDAHIRTRSKEEKSILWENIIRRAQHTNRQHKIYMQVEFDTDREIRRQFQSNYYSIYSIYERFIGNLFDPSKAITFPVDCLSNGKRSEHNHFQDLNHSTWNVLTFDTVLFVDVVVVVFTSIKWAM